MGADFRVWAKDTAERAAFTFLEAFLGLLVVDQVDAFGSAFSLDAVQMAAASALIASLAVVKGAVASRRAGMSPASFVAE